MSLKDAHFHMIAGVSDGAFGSPVADAIGTEAISDVVSMAKYNKCYFVVMQAVGTAGTMSLVVTPCDNATPSNTTTNIPFRYKNITTPDTNGAWIQATSDTYTTTAGSHQLWIIEVNADDLPLVSGVKYEYVKLLATAVDSTAVLAGCIIIMDEPRYAQDVSETVTA